MNEKPKIPEQNELVLATVRKIVPYGAFCTLTEYNNTEAFLHVSEVASRWIKNIHEFLSDNQKLVVRVLRVDREKGQVDVSLRRVNEEEKKNKLESIKRASRSDKLLAIALQKIKSPMKLPELAAKLEEVYGEPYAAMESILGGDTLAEVQIPEDLKKEIIDIVQKSIKRARVSIAAELTFRCFGPDGVAHITRALSVNDDDVKITYVGAPRYHLDVFASDYKEAKKRMDKVLAKISDGAGKDCVFEYSIAE
ncbi:MAG: translation initiation factor IF-2 subunit alpha [Candidatus Micrarchaeia archaeon]